MLYPRLQELLGFVGLSKEKFDVPAKNLNVVELRRIQLAKALATNPKLLLLDELAYRFNSCRIVMKPLNLSSKLTSKG